MGLRIDRPQPKTDPSQSTIPAPKLKQKTSDYNLTVFSHSILGGAFGYILARAVTTRLAPSPRLFAGVDWDVMSCVCTCVYVYTHESINHHPLPSK